MLSYTRQFFGFTFYTYGYSMPISIESEDQYRRLGSHHLFNQIDSITHEDYLYERFSRFKTSVRQSYDIFYIIPVTINFTEFSYNVEQCLYN